MDYPPLINDVLIMLSAIGSAVAGVVCGWQLCSTRLHSSPNPSCSASDADDQTSLSLDDAPLVARPGTRKSIWSIVRSFFSDPASSASTDENGPSGSSYAELPSASQSDQPAVLSPSEICEVAERLIQMADRITADVNAHDAELDRMNHALNSDSTVPTMESVMAAVEKLVGVNETMQSQLRQSRDRIVAQAQEIETAERRANTDALTRVGNRRAFDRELDEWSGETPGVLALVDIDHFKQVNDEHGHAAGDDVLRSVADVLCAKLGNHCLVARYGGEEFGLVFGDRRLEDVLDLIESARRSISDCVTPTGGKELRVNCSLGVTRMLPGEPSAEWLQRADDALYFSKDAGRNCAHCIDSLKIGTRKPPFRLGSDAARPSAQPPVAYESQVASAIPKKFLVPIAAMRNATNLAIYDRLPNCEVLGESYRELLIRLTRAPVKLAVIALSIDEPELSLEASPAGHEVTRFSKLFEVTQAFCRTVDRIGYLDEKTLLICMPGTEGDRALNRMRQLKAVVATQLQVPPLALSIGVASGMIGDTFADLVNRATEFAVQAPSEAR